MAAPKGNKNAQGNIGGGRSKAGEISKLLTLWEEGFDLKDINYTKKNGQVVFKTGFDAFCFKVLTGDLATLRMLVDKLFADKKYIEHTDSFSETRPHLKSMSNAQLMKLKERLKNEGQD